MRGSLKIILAVMAITVPALFYVHGKLSLFRISYDLNRQSEELAFKLQHYRMLKFELEQLKAPHLLEARMKEQALDLVLPQEIRVVQIPAVSPFRTAEVSHPSINPIMYRLRDLLGRWIGIAQAKTETS